MAYKFKSDSKLEKVIQQIEKILEDNNAQITFDNYVTTVRVGDQTGELIDSETSKLILNGVTFPRQFDSEVFRVAE